MELLLRKARICDPSSAFDQQVCDVLIRDGKILEISPAISSRSGTEITLPDLHLSPGWMDIGGICGEPGFEHREDLDSYLKAAAAGGFTAVAPFPNTQPVVQTRGEILHMTHGSKGHPVQLFPIGALSRDAAGKDLGELYDMHHAGAVAFSDGYQVVRNTGLLYRALEYVKAFGGRILHHPQDDSLVPGGVMHEGRHSTYLGLKGIPALSEELMVHRDLELVDFAGSVLFLYNVSTARSVEMIREAKRKGIRVHASVSAWHLNYTDEALGDFNVHFKLLPPLREASDLEALVKGVREGVIDCISSDHNPWDPENKELEFAYASFGSLGLQTLFPLVWKALGKALSLGEIVRILSVHPREALGLTVPRIGVGETADLTLFQPSRTWILDESHILSKSKNSPLVGQTLTGKVAGTILGESWQIQP